MTTLSPARDVAPGQLGVGDRRAPEVHRHRPPAEHLFDRRGDQLAVAAGDPVAQLGKLFRPLDERLHPGRHRVARRVVAGRHEQREEVVELVLAEHLAVDLRCQQVADDVVRRVLTPPPRLLLGVPEQLDAGRAAERHQAELVGVDEADRVGRELRVGVAEQRVTTLDEPRPVFVRHSEQRAEHAHRQLLGDGVDEVEARAARQRVVDDRAGQRADRLLVGVDLAPAERLRHQPAVRRVLGRVELHHRAPGLGLLGVHLLEADPARAGERVDVAAHLRARRRGG